MRDVKVYVTGFETVANNWSEACSAYKGISLIDVVSKVFGVILFKRFQSERDQRARHNKSGFRLGRGCTGQMHNLRRTLEQRWGFQ